MLTLSSKQMQFYNENGYVVVKRFIDEASLETYRRRFYDVVNGTADKGEIVVVPEYIQNSNGSTEKVVNKLQDIHFDEVFSSYTEHAALLAVQRQLCGDSALRVLSSMYINKPPRSRRHPPHQDLVYLPIGPASAVVASWTAIDRATKHNGALFVLPGSHSSGLLYEHGHAPNTNKAYHSVLDESVADLTNMVTLEMEPGDTVFFHSLLVHGSGANEEGSSRNCITAHYAAARAQLVAARDGARATVSRDLDQVAASRGWNCTYEDYLRFRSKLVHTKSRI